MITPDKYKPSEDLVKEHYKSLGFSCSSVEKYYCGTDQGYKNAIISDTSVESLLQRLAPDLIVIKGEEKYYVETKTQSTKNPDVLNLEFVQIILNIESISKKNGTARKVKYAIVDNTQTKIITIVDPRIFVRCGEHVHIPSGTRYSPEQLGYVKRLAKKYEYHIHEKEAIPGCSNDPYIVVYFRGDHGNNFVIQTKQSKII